MTAHHLLKVFEERRRREREDYALWGEAAGICLRRIERRRQELIARGEMPLPPRRPIPEPLRWKVFKRDGYRCTKCGCDHSLTVDHRVPVSLGGETVEDNLDTLCRSCNAKKSNQVESL